MCGQESNDSASGFPSAPRNGLREMTTPLRLVVVGAAVWLLSPAAAQCDPGYYEDDQQDCTACPAGQYQVMMTLSSPFRAEADAAPSAQLVTVSPPAPSPVSSGPERLYRSFLYGVPGRAVRRGHGRFGLHHLPRGLLLGRRGERLHALRCGPSLGLRLLVVLDLPSGKVRT